MEMKTCCNETEKVKKIQFGILIEEPREDKSFTVLRLEDKETIHTSKVEKFISYYDDKIWIVETQNSIYVLKKSEID